MKTILCQQCHKPVAVELIYKNKKPTKINVTCVQCWGVMAQPVKREKVTQDPYEAHMLDKEIKVYNHDEEVKRLNALNAMNYVYEDNNKDFFGRDL